MHQSVREWMERYAWEFAQGEGLSILEVGSLDVNGGVRDLFPKASSYIGTDLVAGPGVDIVSDILETPGWRAGFGLVICLEMLEHCRAPWIAIFNMHRALRPGGTLLLTTRGYGFHLHEHPVDYWRFGPGCLENLLEDVGFTEYEVAPDTDPGSPGWFLWAQRKEEE